MAHPEPPPLSEAEIDSFFKTQLPYRLKMLLKYCVGANSSPLSPDSEYFVAAAITGRLLLNILGIGKDGLFLGRPREQRYTGAAGRDVNATDLGGELADLSKLTPTDEDLLVKLIVQPVHNARLTGLSTLRRKGGPAKLRLSRI